MASKFLATSLPCGVALAKKENVHLAFHKKDIKVGYVNDIHDITIAGGRSVLTISQLHLSLKELGFIDQEYKKFRLLLDQSLKLAVYFYDKISAMLGADKVIYNTGQFNIIFPLMMTDDHAKKLKEKYTLMPVGRDRACVSVFPHVTQSLLDEFIADYEYFAHVSKAGICRSKL